jgi:hypothetical protein
VIPAPATRTSQCNPSVTGRIPRGGARAQGVRGLRKSACSASSGCPVKDGRLRCKGTGFPGPALITRRVTLRSHEVLRE